MASTVHACLHMVVIVGFAAGAWERKNKQTYNHIFVILRYRRTVICLFGPKPLLKVEYHHKFEERYELSLSTVKKIIIRSLIRQVLIIVAQRTNCSGEGNRTGEPPRGGLFLQSCHEVDWFHLALWLLRSGIPDLAIPPHGRNGSMFKEHFRVVPFSRRIRIHPKTWLTWLVYRCEVPCGCKLKSLEVNLRYIQRRRQ